MLAYLQSFVFAEPLDPNIRIIPVEFHANGSSHRVDAAVYDVRPEKSLGTVIAIHGSPGSHNDFKYIVPHAKRHGYRFVGINFPGYGFTAWSNRLRQNNTERLAYVQAIFNSLKIDGLVTFLGHSRGSENALKMGATNTDCTVGVILVNPLGIKRHRAARPFIKVGLATFLWNFGILTQWFMGPILFVIYRLMGLRVPSCSVAGRSIECMFRSNLCDQKDYIARITESKAKTLILYGGQDSLIEESVSRHFVTSFPGNCGHICTEHSSERTLLKRIERSWRERKHVSVFCPDDGHFIQKHRAKFIANAIRHLFCTYGSKL